MHVSELCAQAVPYVCKSDEVVVDPEILHLQNDRSHEDMPYIYYLHLANISQLHSVYKDLRLKLSKVLEEAVEQVNTVFYIVGTSRLANGVHGKLRVANIDGPCAERRAQHRTNGATAGHVVPDNEHLKWHTLALPGSF